MHTDLCGPMSVSTHTNKKYMLTFIDDYSRYTKIYLLHKKSEVNEKLIEFVTLVKNQFKTKPKKFNSDRGGEYMSNYLENYFNSEGIEIQYTAPYTPELNGIAERKNRSLIEMVRCMLNESKLPKIFWGEAAVTANYLQNRLETSSIKKTPYEMLFNKKPRVKDIEIFGIKCYVKIPKEKRKKLDKKSNELILLGYDENNSNIYRCYDTETNKIIISRDVSFIQNDKKLDNGIELYFKSSEETKNDNIESSSSSSTTSKNNSESDSESESIDPYEIPLPEMSEDSSSETPRPFMRISMRSNKGVPPKRFGYDSN